MERGGGRRDTLFSRLLLLVASPPPPTQQTPSELNSNLESNDLELLVLPLLPQEVLVLVKQPHQRLAEPPVRLVDQLLARVLVPLDGDRLPDQRDDVGAARQREARGAPQQAQGGARPARELARTGEGQELRGAEVVDRDEICFFSPVCSSFWRERRRRRRRRRSRRKW